MKSAQPKSSVESTHSATPILSRDQKNNFFASKANAPQSFFSPTTIQPKLKIGQPGDKYEQEADRVADAVVNSPDAPNLQRRSVEEEEEMLQTQPLEEEEETLQTQPMEEEEELQAKREPGIQRKCEECEQEENLQTKQKPRGHTQSGVASSKLSHQLKSKSGNGSRLPEGVQTEMSQKIGANFSGVNIHTDSNAHQMNQQLGARAFTHGRDIYFNEDEYSPTSNSGKHLLAHELTHVVQQTAKNPPNIQRQVAGCNPCPSPPNPDIDVKIRPVLQYSNLGAGHFGSTRWTGANVPFLSIWHRERRNCNTCGPSGNSAEYDLCPRKAVIRANVPVLINRNELNRRGPNGERWFQDCNSPSDRRFITRATAQSSMTTPQPITVQSTRVHEGYHIDVSEQVLEQQLSNRNDISTVCPYNRTTIDNWKSSLETTWQNQTRSILRGNPSEPSEEGNARTHECNSY
ncbi:DUF4157 domain-containing protein [Aliifodinibius salicampi]|uniref:DUF4157 domain-containing protein n=1 Tax=Fodinibius salicampi TaxID=1920655 RepID=A0ABT3PZ19_9BACT|nr:DUF4157 domain-containing protein [Fodinibius salicampi]MCW9713098.1 DUF4157 domain-containing protein [Fodinibius salicampi]